MAESLEALERWVQALITHPGGPRAGAAGADARAALDASLEDVLLPSPRLAAEDRIGVYAGMYFDRLVEVLEEEFPALAHLLGRVEAHALFHAYVAAHPSRHYSLNVLGRHVAAFLQGEGSALAPGLRPFAVELARLERTIQDVFDAPETTERLGADELAAVPPDRWARARLVPSAALALLAFEHPVDAWYQAFRDDAPVAPPAPAPSWTAVFRQEGRVWRMDLSREQHALLAALVAGAPLEPALLALGALPGVDLAVVGTELQGWFRTWAAEGFFARVELESAANAQDARA